jgi:hypothetical protein
MGAREDILKRLRLAEERFAVVPSSSQHQHEHEQLPSIKEVELFSDYAASGADLLAQFCANFERLRGTARVCDDIPAAAAALLELAPGRAADSSEISTETVLAQDDELVRSVWQFIPETQKSRFRLLDSAAVSSIDNSIFARAGTGVTTCDLLIARSGSIAIRSTSAGGRRLSVVPEHHIVIARAEQISAGLLPWYEKIGGDSDWSYGVLISGPSRTSDIEKILVLGAHGPKRLSAIIIK